MKPSASPGSSFTLASGSKLALCALATAALTWGTPPAHAVTFTFQNIVNPTGNLGGTGDSNFNQALGINTAGTIAGYAGDGVVVPNKGYTVVAPFAPANFTSENFPGSVQTQVVGINSNASPTTVGFYINAAGTNFGFVDQNSSFTSVMDPNTGTGTVNQLLGVNNNNNNIASGFYVDGAGISHGYLYNIATMAFTPVTLPASFNSVNITATGVNNAGAISGQTVWKHCLQRRRLINQLQLQLLSEFSERQFDGERFVECRAFRQHPNWIERHLGRGF